MKAAIHNLGCKTNSYESEAMEQALRDAGYTVVPFAGEVPADIYIINTCSVTNIADRKSRQMIHKARTLNPAAVVVAVGCFVQTSSRENLEKEGIDICIGSNDKGKLLEAVSGFLQDGVRRIEVSDIQNGSEYESLTLNKSPKRTRAFIKIEDGCNQFCTFCIIPYARGRVRSRSLSAVISEVEGLVSKGIKEIVLTGINMSAYGTDLEPRIDIGDVILKLNHIEGLKRIRISSLEPGLISRTFLEKIKAADKLCPHFHLSLQSGCDAILKRMNRRYTCEEYLGKCNLLREYFENPSITTDIIVGFPGETEAEFRETLEFVQKIDFFDIHVFAYSPREGTPAAKMTGQTDGRVKHLRSAILIQKAEELKKKHLEAYIETDDEVLAEEIISLKLPDEASKGYFVEKNYYCGHTKRYVKVLIPVIQEGLEGQLVQVRLHKVCSEVKGFIGLLDTSQ